MKKNVLIIICLFLLSCSASRKGMVTGKPLTWNEQPDRSVAVIAFGVPAVHGSDVEYKRAGKTEFRFRLAEPQVIVVADKPQPWGYYQFPTVERLTDGSLHAEWSMHADAIESYGLSAVGSAVSGDRANTWEYRMPDSTLKQGYRVPNGDQIKVKDPIPLKATDLKMPAPLGMTNFKYRKTNFTFYRTNDMPPGRNGVFLNRRAGGSNEWKLEEAALSDPQGVRYSSRGLVPVVWWGDIHTMKDSSLVAGVYPAYYLKPNGELDKQMGVVFYRSVDNGHSWKFQGRIPFTPDRKIDSMATDRIGFSEPAYEVLADGSFLCVIRSADGDGVTNGVGNGPMYASRSTDMGVTWSAPAVIAPAGALPRLLRLKNGVTVLSSGRPGVQLRFTKTGENGSWTDPFEMLPYENNYMQVQYLVSCGYTGLLETGPNSFLIIYSDFRYPVAGGEQRKAIKIREVTVEPR